MNTGLCRAPAQGSSLHTWAARYCSWATWAPAQLPTTTEHTHTVCRPAAPARPICASSQRQNTNTSYTTIEPIHLLRLTHGESTRPFYYSSDELKAPTAQSSIVYWRDILKFTGKALRSIVLKRSCHSLDCLPEYMRMNCGRRR